MSKIGTKLLLSERLLQIAACIPDSSRFLDVGSDHAYLPCHVCKQDKHAFAIAGEVRTGPLKRAHRTVKAYGLSDRIDVRLGNGLEVMRHDDKIDTIIIAGMGGKLITAILYDGIQKLDPVERLILQPNTDANLVRQFCIGQAFQLKQEIILEENGHFYEIVVAERTAQQNMDQQSDALDKQLLFGPRLLQEKSPAFIKKWEQEYQHLTKVLLQMERAKHPDEEKMEKVKSQMAWIKEVLQ